MKRVTNLLLCVGQIRHHLVHLLFGTLAAVIIYSLSSSSNIPFLPLLVVASLASILPDLDHFLFVYIYSPSSEYARRFKHYLHKGEIGKWAKFCRLNHKQNFGAYGHNALTLVAAFVLAWLFLRANNPLWATFWLSFGFHFIYDILEDILLLGKPNPNWLLAFQPEPQNLVEVEEFSVTELGAKEEIVAPSEPGPRKE